MNLLRFAVGALAAAFLAVRQSQPDKIVSGASDRAFRARMTKTAWVTSSARWESRT